MAGSRRFRVDSRRVVHETIDGETILIDLQSGNYYSLGGCGSSVWDLLTRGEVAASSKISADGQARL